jgi:transposase
MATSFFSVYLLRTGCSWRQMPYDLPNGKTVYHSFRQWKLDGTWEKAMTALRKHVRVQSAQRWLSGPASLMENRAPVRLADPFSPFRPRL